MHPRTPQKLRHVIGRRVDLLEFSTRNLARDLAGKFPNFTLELPNAGLPRVTLDDREEGLVFHLQLGIGQGIFLPLTTEQIPLRDLQLLGLGVSGEVDSFHTVEKRARNTIQIVRGRDKEHLRKIERDPEIVIDERGVLSGVEHL